MNFPSKISGAVAIVASIVLSSQVALTQGPGAEVIRVRGSESAAGIVDAYARAFMASNPNCNVVVSGGQKSGWPNFLKGESDICMSSLRIRDDERRSAREKGMELEEAIVGWGGIVIIVNASNPQNELTVEQVRKVFTGQYNNWNQVGGYANEPLSVYVVGEKMSETVEYVTREVLNGPFGKYAIPKTYFHLVASAVAEEPYAVGLVRFRNVAQFREQEIEKKVKILAIKKDEQSPAAAPSRSSLDDGTYPISRPYYLCIDRKSAGKLANQFFDFCANKNPRKK